MMDTFGPFFREACRRVLGKDDPDTLVEVLASGGPVLEQVEAVMLELTLKDIRSGEH